MSKIVSRTKELAIELADKLGLEIIDVEWIKERDDFILRITCDNPKTGLTLDDSVALNEALSEKLDEEDFIIQSYMLEVSSPGLEREIKNDEEIKKAIDKFVHIKLYAKLEGEKEFTGYLRSFDGKDLRIEVNQKGRLKTYLIPKVRISKIRYAVKF